MLRALFALWYWPIIIFLTCSVSLVTVVISWFSSRWARYCTNFIWSYIVFIPAGIKVKAEGLENLPPDGSGGFVIFANHRSLTDIPALSLATNRYVTWVAKESLGKIPFFGWALATVHLFVNRGGGAEAAKKMVADAGARLDKGEILAIFLEGTRNNTPDPLLPFKKGAFILAKHSNTPLVPVAIIDSEKVWPPKTYLPHPGRVITVRVGTPLPPVENENLNNLTKRAQEAMSALLAG